MRLLLDRGVEWTRCRPAVDANLMLTSRARTVRVFDRVPEQGLLLA